MANGNDSHLIDGSTYHCAGRVAGQGLHTDIIVGAFSVVHRESDHLICGQINLIFGTKDLVDTDLNSFGVVGVVAFLVSDSVDEDRTCGLLILSREGVCIQQLITDFDKGCVQLFLTIGAADSVITLQMLDGIVDADAVQIIKESLSASLGIACLGDNDLHGIGTVRHIHHDGIAVFILLDLAIHLQRNLAQGQGGNLVVVAGSSQIIHHQSILGNQVLTILIDSGVAFVQHGNHDTGGGIGAAVDIHAGAGEGEGCGCAAVLIIRNLMGAAVGIAGVISQGIFPTMDTALGTVRGGVFARLSVLTLVSAGAVLGPGTGVDDTGGTGFFVGHKGIFVIHIVGGKYTDLCPHVAICIGRSGLDGCVIRGTEDIEGIKAIPIGVGGLIGDLTVFHSNLAVVLGDRGERRIEVVVAIHIQALGADGHEEVSRINSHLLGIVHNIDLRGQVSGGDGEGSLNLPLLAVFVGIGILRFVDTGAALVGGGNTVSDNTVGCFYAGNRDHQLGAGMINTDELGIDLIIIQGICVVEAGNRNHTILVNLGVQGHLGLVSCAVDDDSAGAFLYFRIIKGQNLLCFAPGDLVGGHLISGQVFILLADATGNHGNGDSGIVGQHEVGSHYILQDCIHTQSGFGSEGGCLGGDGLEDSAQIIDGGGVLVVVRIGVIVHNGLRQHVDIADYAGDCIHRAGTDQDLSVISDVSSIVNTGVVGIVRNGDRPEVFSSVIVDDLAEVGGNTVIATVNITCILQESATSAGFSHIHLDRLSGKAVAHIVGRQLIHEGFDAGCRGSLVNTHGIDLGTGFLDLHDLGKGRVAVALGIAVIARDTVGKDDDHALALDTVIGNIRQHSGSHLQTIERSGGAACSQIINHLGDIRINIALSVFTVGNIFPRCLIVCIGQQIAGCTNGIDLVVIEQVFICFGCDIAICILCLGCQGNVLRSRCSTGRHHPGTVSDISSDDFVDSVLIRITLNSIVLAADDILDTFNRNVLQSAEVLKLSVDKEAGIDPRIILNIVGIGQTILHNTGSALLSSGCESADRNAMVHTKGLAIGLQGLNKRRDRTLKGFQRTAAITRDQRTGLVQNQNHIQGNSVNNGSGNGGTGSIGLQVDGVGTVILQSCLLIHIQVAADILGRNDGDLGPHVAVFVSSCTGDRGVIGSTEQVEGIGILPVILGEGIGESSVSIHGYFTVFRFNFGTGSAKVMISIRIRIDTADGHQEILGINGNRLAVIQIVGLGRQIGGGDGEGCLHLALLAVAVDIGFRTLIDAGGTIVGGGNTVRNNVGCCFDTGNGNHQLGAGVTVADVLGIILVVVCGIRVVVAGDCDHTILRSRGSDGHLRPVSCAVDDDLALTGGCGGVSEGQDLLGIAPGNLIRGQLFFGKILVCLADTAGNHGDRDGGLVGQLEAVRHDILQDRIGAQSRFRAKSSRLACNSMEDFNQLIQFCGMLIVICIRVIIYFCST